MLNKVVRSVFEKIVSVDDINVKQSDPKVTTLWGRAYRAVTIQAIKHLYCHANQINLPSNQQRNNEGEVISLSEQQAVLVPAQPTGASVKRRRVEQNIRLSDHQTYSRDIGFLIATRLKY